MTDRDLHVSGLEGHRALAHPLRLRILRLLREEPRSASGLARELGVLPGTARFHLKVLERAGIARRAGARDIRGGHELLYTAPEAVHFDDDVEPAIRWATDRAYLEELGRLLESGATDPGGAADFGLAVHRLRPRDVGEAQRIMRDASKRLAALSRPDDPAARPHLVASQLVRLPSTETSP
jgi:DNA-binding transcriptional ArsR family regulator